VSGAIGSADITRLAEALRQSGQDAEATTQRVLVEVANFILTEMEVRVPVDTGELRQSLRVQVVGDTVRIGPTAEHGVYVEFGTRPHVIRPKNPDGVLAFTVNGRKVFAKVVNHPGTKAQPFVRPAFQAWVDRLGGMVEEANVKVLKENYGG
jgi:HK97 gp10 family phage protein